jgi:biopolymer transport protein ExbD
MPRVKVARKSTAIDMTAMCDVAFLLLTFFILSAKPKSQDPIKAEVPSSTAIQVIPENDMTTLIVTQGKVFFSTDGAEIRKQTLKQMGEKYKIGFTADETNKFAGIESFGVPIAQLRQYLDLTNQQRASVKQPGIPIDTTDNNELYSWVHEARVASKYLHNKEMRIAVKGDSKEEYPTIKTVIATLQKQKVDRFSLITSLKTVKK